MKIMQIENRETIFDLLWLSSEGNAQEVRCFRGCRQGTLSRVTKVRGIFLVMLYIYSAFQPFGTVILTFCGYLERIV